MADPIVGIVAKLKADPTLTTIVSGRVRPLPAPEQVDSSHYPCVTYQVASEVQSYNYDGPDNVNTMRVVFDCYSELYSEARKSALAIRDSLNGYSGTLPDGTLVFETEIATINDGWFDVARMAKSSVHVLVTYSG